jgi:hypothetical protein
MVSEIVSERQKVQARQWEDLLGALDWASKIFDGPAEHVIYSLFRWRHVLDRLCATEGVAPPTFDIQSVLGAVSTTIETHRKPVLAANVLQFPSKGRPTIAYEEHSG